ncbi:hypothetical protein AVEN_40652-1 [Araneus ventricosus]|uniref:Uncharacterized protein n=1 Tax=Araneus ventricosus TaxID=182803 RepID=A0A4Y2H0Z0_ARAVE|nr:hypothetical protein AVEN_40652-1 [Araneus ventricosus]
MDSPLEEFNSYIRNIGEATIEGIANEGINYQGLGPVVIDLMQRVERVHITLSNEETFHEELDNILISELFGLNPKHFSISQVMSFLNLSKGGITKEGISFFKRKLSKLSKMNIVYEDNPHISSQLEHFLSHRLKLINNLLAYGNELDRNYFLTTIVRLFGYGMGIICSLNFHAYLGGIQFSSKLSPFLGHSFRCLLVAAAYFRPICLLTSCAEFFRSIYIVNCSINLIEEDRRNFGPLEKCFSEKRAMQAIVTELFLQEIDEQVIKNAEETLMHLTSAQKIFAAVLVASMQKYPLCIQDGRFLHITYQFSQTEEAKEWYRRMSYYIDPVDEAKDTEVLEEGLLQLKIINRTPSLPLQAFLFLFMPPILPGIALSGLYSVCIFYEIKEFKCVKKCMLSKDLRNLALQSKKLFECTRSALGFRR